MTIIIIIIIIISFSRHFLSRRLKEKKEWLSVHEKGNSILVSGGGVQGVRTRVSSFYFLPSLASNLRLGEVEIANSGESCLGGERDEKELELRNRLADG